MSRGSGWVDRRMQGLRWRVAQALVPRRRVRSRGVRFTLPCDNWITQYRWATFDGKEPETLDWIDRSLHDGDLFFDIGANIGLYTLYAALRHPGIRVVAFEPEYANLHLLRDNLVANGLQDRVDVYSVALSQRNGLSRLHLQALEPGAALHTESPAPLAMTRARRPVVWREGIYAMTLDTFCDEAGLRPHGLKIDVDGTEGEILTGAARTLRAAPLRTVLVETEAGVRAACAAQLSAAGFHPAWEDPAGRSPNVVWERRMAT